ncbi:hypothetical protein SEA_NAIRB_29 [Mycobacterium phage Nairb]|uniref:Uncharacterized protein n=5 Tax=Bernalvirus bernal13 TaxID=1982102 RepID=A0A2P1JRP0_9CAUD|nr:hypothetical protein FH37_gp29 [Mycobacterium phage Bernal13]AIT13442.1 hypothetical protein PBI_RONRAYGUN_29 [Mycobacterium phage RonRayGun]ASJ79110.1 hypothetical protein SEA_ZENTIME222_29 [Mycobacterium phage ZenTime222]AVO21817.1 hypothetical protein SEA_NAIRB_29 [Mycobacterium phage Nairb]QBP28874.1 hypothetical protein SEA_IBRAHIM_29 [Mycobacterium phage Ibrahim]QHB47435.1 hypothetical protein SEA_WHITTY_29 [Mycobacterium phage Whitty]
MTAPTSALSHLLELPVEVVDGIKDVVDRFLDAGQEDPSADQLPAAASGIESVVAKAIDAAITDLDVVLKWFAFLIPDRYEESLRDLQSALRKIRDWLD